LKHPVEVIDLEKELDRLFQQPLETFTGARNAIASRLKAAGRPADAEQVRGIAKPSAAAWALNQVYWTARGDFDRLLEAGDRLRKAQLAGLKGKSSALGDAMNARQQAVNAAVDRAAAILEAAGSPPSETTRRRLGVTADALAAHGTLPSRPHAGRLIDDLEPPGFSLLASLAPAGLPSQKEPATASGRTALKPRSTEAATSARPAKSQQAIPGKEERARERKEALGRAEFDLARATAELRRRTSDAQRAAREAETVEARADSADAEVETARARLETAERRAKETVDARDAARAKASEARAAVTEAEESVNAARERLDALRKRSEE
jgi:hypothetical protein